MAIKKKVKPGTSHDILFETFCGEAITIMIDRDVEQSKQTETTVETLKTSISVQGYLIELDDNFLYLGYDPDTIDQAICRSSVVHIEMIDNPLDDIMNGMGTKTDGGFN